MYWLTDWLHCHRLLPPPHLPLEYSQLKCALYTVEITCNRRQTSDWLLQQLLIAFSSSEEKEKPFTDLLANSWHYILLFFCWCPCRRWLVEVVVDKKVGMQKSVYNSDITVVHGGVLGEIPHCQRQHFQSIFSQISFGWAIGYAYKPLAKYGSKRVCLVRVRVFFGADRNPKRI